MKLTRRTFIAGAAAGAALPAGLAQVGRVHAAAPAAGKQVPGIYRYKIGEFELTAINDGAVKPPKPESLVANQPFSEVQKALEAAYLPKNEITVPFTTLLVNTGKNLVLIDCGFGDNGPGTTGALLSNLGILGVDPKAIDTVLISHFHPDHISGIRAKAGSANFPNAEIMVPEAEWKYWNDDAELAKAPEAFKSWFPNVKRVFDPIAKDVKRYEYGKELVSGITSVDARGHSPGHAGFVIASGSAKLLVISDTTQTPYIFARNPEWHLWADMDKGLAVTTRRKLLDMAAADRLPIAGYHYPFPAVGHIAKLGQGYDFVPTAWQSIF